MDPLDGWKRPGPQGDRSMDRSKPGEAEESSLKSALHELAAWRSGLDLDLLPLLSTQAYEFAGRERSQVRSTLLNMDEALGMLSISFKNAFHLRSGEKNSSSLWSI